MKEKLNYVKNIIIILYILLIIFITICLLSYNDYKVTEFGNTTILPVIDENLEPNYSVGDLLILKKNISDISVGDTIFFYRTTFGETVVNFAKVTNVEIVTKTESTITVEGDYMFSSQYFIGKASTARIVPIVGRVISLLESKYGFLFLGVLPSLLIFLYTGYTLFLEVRTDEEEEEEETPKTSKKLGKNKIKLEDKKQDEIINDKDIEEEKNAKKEITVEKATTENTKSVDEIKEESAEKQKKAKIETEKEVQTEKAKTEIKDNVKEEPKTIDKETTNKAQNETKTETKAAEKKTITEQEKKALIEEKMKTMTEEQKKALIEAKLKTMTEEQKKALIEAKRKKMQENKNK